MTPLLLPSLLTTIPQIIVLRSAEGYISGAQIKTAAIPKQENLQPDLLSCDANKHSYILGQSSAQIYGGNCLSATSRLTCNS